ncbi:BRCA2 and CDKN1A-interacting protein [Octopus bimaculoides]|uniref:BRCA2 and CDKN1A-interacting protein n=1 Tax=Octopus bimaculoides TaxID=37653 RepID=UPI0022DF9036|nr:BRCA2 and CDKN1A-interacting protein [Octopus bimaculoides]
MATPSKKRDVEEMDVQSDEDDDDLDDYSSSEEEDEDGIADEDVQVDFEAVPPTDADANGIRTLLSQLFLKANINLGQLADTIISQNYIGCVLKVLNTFVTNFYVWLDGFFSFLFSSSLTLSNLESVKQLKAMLLMQCEKWAADKLPVFNQILLDTCEKQIGFLISERFINMPSSVAVPLYESLSKDLQSEKVNKMNYKFDQFILISKTCRPRIEGSKERPVDENEITFLNLEEQVLLEIAKNNSGVRLVSQELSYLLKLLPLAQEVYVTAEYKQCAKH